MSKKAKIVIWDIETSGILASTWNLWPQHGIPYQNVIEDWYLMSVAWKELGAKRTSVVTLLDDPKRFKKNFRDDYHIVKTVGEMLQTVDVLIAHNGDKFDLKMFNSRLIYHKLPPLPKIVTIDTLKAVKRVAKFTSNRLDFLNSNLNGLGKMETSPGLWLKCMKGDVKAIKEMAEYNKIDVVRNEELYMRIRPYMVNHPNLSVAMECPTCGEDSLRANGTKMRATGSIAQMYKCSSCGAHSTGTKSVSTPKVKK